MADPRDRAKTPCFSAALVLVLYEKGEKAPAEGRRESGEREKEGDEGSRAYRYTRDTASRLCIVSCDTFVVVVVSTGSRLLLLQPTLSRSSSSFPFSSFAPRDAHSRAISLPVSMSFTPFSNLAFPSIVLPPSFFHGVHHRRDAIGPTLFVPFVLPASSSSSSSFSSLLFPSLLFAATLAPPPAAALSLFRLLSFTTSMPSLRFSTRRSSFVSRHILARSRVSRSASSSPLCPFFSITAVRVLVARCSVPRSHQPHRPRRASGVVDPTPDFGSLNS